MEKIMGRIQVNNLGLWVSPRGPLLFYPSWDRPSLFIKYSRTPRSVGWPINARYWLWHRLSLEIDFPLLTSQMNIKLDPNPTSSVHFPLDFWCLYRSKIFQRSKCLPLMEWHAEKISIDSIKESRTIIVTVIVNLVLLLQNSNEHELLKFPKKLLQSFGRPQLCHSVNTNPMVVAQHTTKVRTTTYGRHKVGQLPPTRN